MTNFKLLLCKASHQQHETVEENEDTDLPAKIGTQSSAEKPKEDSAQKHTKKTQQVLDIIDEDDSPPSPTPRPKKTKRRMHKKKATVINSDDSSSDDQTIRNKKRTQTKAAIVDTDIEEIPNPKEDSEEELGEN